MGAASRSSMSAVLRVVAMQWKLFLYLVVLMTFMMFLSHGTQDLYPDFLQAEHKAQPGDRGEDHHSGKYWSIVGGIIFGALSKRPAGGRAWCWRWDCACW